MSLLRSAASVSLLVVLYYVAPLDAPLDFASWTLFGAGLLREMFLSSELDALPRERPACLALGITEIATVLGTLDLLFMLFVAIQCRYLFGGAGVVQATTGLTCADYARRGFFELATVTALALPLLLLADWLLRKEGRAPVRLFRLLAGLLAAMLFVVMASALQRMRLYERVYGLTELRVYATGVIVWLAVVFAWFAATVLRGRRRHFAVGVVVAGFAATLALDFVNPDALIARTNLARPRVDVAYLAGLGDDAVPTLVARLPHLEPGLRRPLAEALLRRHENGDWRSWSLSRSRARVDLRRLTRP